jgi:hypothetical protein
MTVNEPARLVNFACHIHANGKKDLRRSDLPERNYRDFELRRVQHAWFKTDHYQKDVAPLLPKGAILLIIAGTTTRRRILAL